MKLTSITELVTGSKTSDPGVQHAMLQALYEVVSKAGTNMTESSRSSILGLIDSETGHTDGKLFFEWFHVGQWLTCEQSLWL